MNQTDARTTAADLPEFLHDGEPVPATEATTAEFSTEGPDEGSSEPAGEVDPEMEAAEDTAAAVPAPSPRRARRPAAERGPGTTGRSGGGLWLLLGALGILGGAGLGFAGDAVNARLTPFGATPAAVTLLGAIAFGIGAQARRSARIEARLDGLAQNGDDDVVDRLMAALADHVPTGGGAEANAQIALLLQRQDEKLVNLTKAIKMYGKPLMEIAAHGTELAASVAQVRTTMETGHDVNRQTFARIEQQIREKADVKVAIQPVQDTIGKVQVAVQAVAQRLEDTEVRKSLLRLEENAQKTTQELQQLLRGDSIEQASTRLSQRLDDAQQRLQTGLDQLRDGNLTGMETSIRDIQREVATVATAVAQIQAAMKSGARVAAAAPAPTPNPAPAPAAPVAGPAPAPAPTTGQPAAGEASGYQTGARTSGGKNVLGAIAKLKQMKN